MGQGGSGAMGNRFGGGGGSSYIGGVTGGSTLGGSRGVPGNSADQDRGTAGSSDNHGRVIISW